MLSRAQGGRRPAGLAFTLIELLVVIGIITILSVVVILVLNPNQLILQSRDTNRIADMATLNSAIGIYLAAGGISLGNTNTVYVSLPDPTATSTAGDQCQGLGLPTLPATYSYRCAASSTYRNANGTGWIPIDLAAISVGYPLGYLPVDSINQSSSRDYYTYATNGIQFEVATPIESSKYKVGGSNDVISSDGGLLSSVYERGTAFGLEPLDYGDTSLLGYWPINEGTSTVVYDDSGNGNNGTWAGSQAGTNGYYSAGKSSAWVGAFDGASTYITLGNPALLQVTGSAVTVCVWANGTSFNNSSPDNDVIVSGRSASTAEPYSLGFDASQVSTAYNTTLGWVDTPMASNPTFLVGTWYNVCVTRSGGTNLIYENGQPIQTLIGNAGTPNVGGGILFGKGFYTGTSYWNGAIADVRIYSRALTAAQILAAYLGGK